MSVTVYQLKWCTLPQDLNLYFWDTLSQRCKSSHKVFILLFSLINTWTCWQILLTLPDVKFNENLLAVVKSGQTLYTYCCKWPTNSVLSYYSLPLKDYSLSNVNLQLAKVLDQCVTNHYCTDNLLLSWSWDFGADDFSSCTALSSSAPASGWDAVGWEGADAS